MKYRVGELQLAETSRLPMVLLPALSRTALGHNTFFEKLKKIGSYAL